jgi:cobalamin synthase
LWVRNREEAIDQSDGPLSVSAVIGAGLAWVALLVCLVSVDRWRPIGLLCAPLFGRWAMVVLAFGSRAARSDGRRTKFAKGVTFEEFGWASTATLAIVFWGTGLLGILLLVCAAIPIVGLRVWLHWRLDGITAASMGAACAVAEIVPLLVLALF